MNPSLLIMLVGKPLADACGEIAGALDQFEFVRAGNIAAAMDWVERSGREPDVVLVAQAWPGQVSAAEVELVERRLPLARVCAVLDSWCEGEMRSGKPWPTAGRVYAHQFPQRVARELMLLARSQKCAWALPLTAGDEQRLLVELSPPGRASGQIAVLAASPETGAALGDACRSAGYQVAVMRDAGGVMLPNVSAVVWDTTGDVAADSAAVASLRQSFGAAPIVAMLGFPRADEIAKAKAAGVAAIVSKPFLLEDLHWQLAALLPSDQCAQSVPSPVSSRSVRKISRFHSVS
jgi:CheY-like chemotaxis protein